jgi:hypothetical protein
MMGRENAMTENPQITLQELPRLRRITRGLAESLESELRSHLEFLAPLLRPKRLLGDLIAGQSTESYPDVDDAYAELEQIYAKVYHRLRLHPKLPKPIPSVRVRLEISPWEEAAAPTPTKQLTVVSPLTWVLSYPGACGVADLRAMLAGRAERDEEGIRQFAIHCGILSLLIGRTPGFAKLMRALRYEVEMRRLAECGELAIPVIRSQIPSVRPPGDVMAQAAELAGLASFEEVLDPATLAELEDPLAARIRKLLAQHAA